LLIVMSRKPLFRAIGLSKDDTMTKLSQQLYKWDGIQCCTTCTRMMRIDVVLPSLRSKSVSSVDPSPTKRVWQVFKTCNYAEYKSIISILISPSPQNIALSSAVPSPQILIGLSNKPFNPHPKQSSEWLKLPIAQQRWRSMRN
jgi:hypothetical protein